jgi:hypothetical protein
MRLTLDDLLNALQNPNTKGVKLENNRDTWARIGNGDSFSELGMETSALKAFLQEWIDENPYMNIG